MRNILFGILVFPLLINAQTLVVDGNPDCGIFTDPLASKIVGGIFNDCKSCEANGIADNPYATIQKAIDDANDGDTISICDATYDEQVEIKNKNNLTIKKSDSATDDVNVENDGYIFKLDGIDGITIDSLKINSNNNYGIRIVNRCNNLVFKNLDIDTKRDSIETESDIGDFYIEHSVVNSDGDDGFDFSFNVGSVTFNDVNITASDNAIKFDKNMDGKVELNGLNIEDTVDGIEFNRSNAGFSISDSTIKTQHFAIKTISDVTGDINISNVDINVTNSNAELSGYGIRFESDIKDKLSIVDSNISTKTKSIDLQATADKYIEIDNVKLTSDNSSPFIVHRISNGIKVSNSTIVANSDGNYAVYFYDEVHNGLEISDVNVSSVGRGIYFRNKIYNDLKMDTVDVNSTQSYGIYFNGDVYNGCTLDNITITAKDRGIYIGDVQIDPIITNSNILSKTEHAIYTKNNNGSKFTLKDSCSKTERDGSYYALDIQNSSSNAEITGNCFYASEPHRLAYASVDGNDIDRNYWDGDSEDGEYIDEGHHIRDLNTLKACILPCDDSIALMADYHFDECVVSNDEDKVDDNSSNENNATAFRDINSTDDGLINRAYDFSGEDLPDYVSVPSVVLNKMVNYTFSMWIKPTSLNNGDTFISAEKSDENTDEMLFGISNNKVVFKHKGNDGEISFDTTVNDFTLNEWNYIALTKDGKEVCLYLNDNEKDCKVSSSDNFNLGLSVLDGTFMIGQDSAGIDKYEENGDYQGAIDEVIFFKGALSTDDVDDIYNNQENGKNYDGTDRDDNLCPKCIKMATSNITPLEFEGAEITLNVSTNKPHWTHIDFQKAFSSVPVVFILPDDRGSHPATVRMKDITTTGFDAVFAEPQGEDGPHLDQHINYLAINEGVHKINETTFQVGKIDTQKQQQANQGTLVKDEWENVAVAFDTCNLAVVGQIQSLENETGLADEDDDNIIRSKPFMTTAISSDDGVQLALERSETDEESITKDETIGYMIALPNVQDSVVDDNGNQIDFETIKTDNKFVGWDDSCNKVYFVNDYDDTPLIAANKNTKNEADGGWFRRCDLDKDKIGLKIDEDRGYKRRYGAKKPPEDSERNHIEEVGSIFVFSDSIVIREGTQEEDGNYTFDAWDTFRDINDRNISTKIASKEFSILVASLNETDNDYREFNGTVCTYIKGISFKNLFEDDNTSEQTAQGNPTYTITNANKELNVTIKWQKDVDVECSDLVEDNTTNASDSFAVRAEKFGFVAPSQQVYAGENFLIDFNATDENDNTVDDYNESLNASFEVNASVVKDGCRIGTFDIDDFSFSDGSKDDVDSNYTNIGDLNITIKELDDCSKKYASIDCDDKDVDEWSVEENLSIKSYSHTVNIKPYELNITKADINVSTNADWLYMANIDDMNLSMFATVQANNKQHNKLDDFNSSCYGENVDIKFSIDVDDGDGELDMNSTVIANNSTTKDSFKLKDINKTITISKDYFISGEANASYSINVDRNLSNPVNPFLLKELDINITTSDVAKDENNASDDSNATFYYARVATADKETTDTDIKHFSEIEVYDDSSSKYVAGFKQNSINWYGNKKHNNTFEDISEIDATKKSTLEDVQFAITSFDTDSSKVSFNISNSDNGTYRMHIKTKSWFWYFPAGLGQDYNDSDGSDCTEHPCFEYILKSTSTPSGVVSGEFTGSDYNISSRGNYEKTGVKVFR
ncbi:MAG: LamG-like jellyroll fold domain-containing protein [Campylobacterales bacterium]